MRSPDTWRPRSIVTVLQLAALLFALGGPAALATTIKPDDHSILVPSGKGWGVPAGPGEARRKSGGGSNGITYWGGPVILGTTNVYFIWYGAWSVNPDANTILTDLASSIGGTPYFNINTTYYQVTTVTSFVSNSVAYVMATTDNYSQGTSFGDAGVLAIVSNAINSGALPADANGAYFVLTTPDVNETSGFCTKYCGWHNHATIAGVDIKYAFIGDPDRCPSACEAQSATSPNGDPGADGMANIIAHELEESVTDPDLNAWYDNTGRENADKCAWHFGTEYTAPDGALANMNFGGRDWLIQQNWVNASGGYCAVQYP